MNRNKSAIWASVTLVLLMLFSGFMLEAQAQSGVEKKGLEAVDEFNYSEAIEYFQRVEFLTPMGLRGMAISFARTGQLDSAARYYQLLVKTGFQESEDLYDYANVLKIIGRYDDAFHWMAVYSEERPNDSRPQRHFNDPEYHHRILASSANYSIQNLDANTAQEEFGVSFYGDKIAFTSSRVGVNPVKREWNWTGTPYLYIYTATVDSVGEWQEIEKIEGPFNGRLHDGPIAFNDEATIAVFSRNREDAVSEDGKMNFQLFYSQKTDGNWSSPEGMWFNHSSYSVGHPTLSSDGSVLYFTSDMPGGYGGSDIYMVKKRKGGGWAFPINLGRDINTEGNEMFPYYHEKDSLLYFSSDGHPGIGGLDLFVYRVDGSKVSCISNLGLPFNSNRDDFGLITYPGHRTGYLASNRKGGKGSDDVYYFEAKPQQDSVLYQDPLDVFASEQGDFLYDDGKGGGIRGKFVNRSIKQDSTVLNLYNEDGDRIGSATTDEDGNFVFQGLDFYKSYVIKLSKKDEGLFDQSKIYFMDAEGNVVDSAQTLLFNAYSFQYLPKEYTLRPIVEEVDESSLSILGQFTYKGLGAGPVKLEIMDELDLRDTITHDVNLWAVDVFYDTPIGNKGSSYNVYVAFYNFDFGPNYRLTNSSDLIATGRIIYAQTGYTFPSFSEAGDLQPYASYSFRELEAFSDPAQTWSVGANWYLSGHNAKITVEYSRNTRGSLLANQINLQAMIHL